MNQRSDSETEGDFRDFFKLLFSFLLSFNLSLILFQLEYEMSENRNVHFKVFRHQCDMVDQRYSIYSYRKRRKAEDPQLKAAGKSEYLAF